MGVNLANLIPKHEVRIESLNGKTLALDTSNILYQFLSSIRQQDGTLLRDLNGNVTSHLVGLSSRIPKLMSLGLKICFVLDGKSPRLKHTEQQHREARKKFAEGKFEEARLKEDSEQMYKYSMQTTRLTEDMINEAKDLVTAFGLPIVQAPSEAEAQASYMTRNGIYAIVSQDYDSLLFGANKVVRNLTLSQRKKLPSGISVSVRPEMIELTEVLENLGINHDQLIIIGILVGTDFNVNGVKGIGPKNALKLVKGNKNFDAIFENYDIDFDWKEILDLFKNIPVTDEYKLKWGNVDGEKVRELLIEKHDFSRDRVEKIFETLGRKTGQAGLDKWI